MSNQNEKLIKTVLTIDENTEALLLTENQKRLLIYLQEENYLSDDLIISYDMQDYKTI